MSGHLKEERFHVQGMRCASCANGLEKMLNENPNFKATVNFAANLATIEHNLSSEEFKKQLDQIKVKAKSAGFSLSSVDTGAQERAEEAKKEALKTKLLLLGSVICTLCFVPGMIKHQWMLPQGVQFTLAILSEGVFAFPILKSAWSTLKRFSANMDTLVSLATLTALIYSSTVFILGLHQETYFDASVTIITFILFGRMLEGFAKRQARSDIDGLGNLLPNTAHMIKVKDGERTVKEVATSTLRAGDIVLVRAGDGFPADGIILEGNSDIDEQAFSGESMPVNKKVGDEVFAGTINISQPLDIKITEAGHDSALGKLNDQALNAVASRPNLQRIADKVSALFTPFLILVALATLGGNLFFGETFQTGLIRAVAVLVVACPCALGLATPIVFLVGISKAAKQGILFKNAQSIEKACKLEIIAFDKTGTLTEGKPEVVSTYTSQGVKLDEALSIIHALEQHSEHPLGRAFNAFIEQRNATLSTPSLDAVEVKAGGGIQGVLKGHPTPILLGNKRFLEDGNVAFSEELKDWAYAQERDGCSLSYLAVDSQVKACIAFADTIRPESAPIVKSLKESGITSLMLSGDNHEAAKKVAEKLGIQEYSAPLTPKEKAERIAELEESSKGLVGMIGDGINDSVALAKADLSFSMGNASVLIQDKIDVLFLNDNLRLLPNSLSLAHACMKKAKQNLGLAFGYNSLAIPAAACGFLSPEIASLLMAMSSITVVLNALTLKAWRA